MPLVRTLTIPQILPASDAITSWGDNRHSYEPTFWELQYHAFRYLRDVADNELGDRYRAIVRNMSALTTADRDVIPIQSFLSSWYWFKKEHQTRLEFHFRKTEPPCSPPSGPAIGTGRPAPVRPRFPNAGDILFRYGKRQYMEGALVRGRIRIAPAVHYLKMEHDAARQDDELNKHSFVSGQYTKIILQSGETIPVIGNVRYTTSTSGYLLLCAACDWDETLFDEFDGDACLVIRDGERFAARLEEATQRLHGEWKFTHLPVEYFDPCDKQPKQVFNAIGSKDFRFAYQREYRFFWLAGDKNSTLDAQCLECGSLADIAELVEKPH